MAKENNTTSQSEALQRVAQRAEEAKNKAETEQKQLPLWADWERAMPTSISRSALFAPIGRGRRKRHVDAVIDSRKDVLLTYTGEQLDMSDADVFMQALDLAKRHTLGARFTVNRAQILAAIGRTYQSESADGKVRKAAIGKNDYEWLDAAMKRLAEGSLTFEFKSTGKRKARGGVLHLIQGWLWDDASNSYVMSIEPEIHKLFESFSRIYLEKHLALPKSDQLAKWMHLFVAGCANGELTKIGLDHLRAYSGNKERRMDHFATAMERSLKALEEAGIISPGWFIRANDRMVHFTRAM
jgi:hypothetical protein